MNATAQEEITAYVDRVKAALAGLPEDTIAELTEDLPEHLAEVQAEGIGSLTDRLGTPEMYAAELRGAAGFVGGFPDPPVEPREHPRDQLLRVLRRADDRVGPLLGYAKASDFLVLLRPAWWVLRGYLLAMVLAWGLDNTGSNMGLLPRLGGSILVAFVLLVAAIVGSIWVGRADLGPRRWPRLALGLGSTVLVLVGLSGFLAADRTAAEGPVYNSAPVSAYAAPTPATDAQDVYVYDAQGRLINGAKLYDQDGHPILVGDPYCAAFHPGEVTEQLTPVPMLTPSDDVGNTAPPVNGYPMCGAPRWPGGGASASTTPSSPVPSSVHPS